MLKLLLQIWLNNLTMFSAELEDGFPKGSLSAPLEQQGSANMVQKRMYCNLDNKRTQVVLHHL